MGDGIASQLSPTRCWVRRGEVGRAGNSGQGFDGEVWKRTPLAGETEASINKALGMVPVTCVAVVLGEWKGLGRSDYWGEPELIELRKEALDWGVAGQELEGGFPGVC